jgi:hypothetical protein
LAFAAIESFDDGVEEFEESIPNRRRSSASSSCNLLISSTCAANISPCVAICAACTSI